MPQVALSFIGCCGRGEKKKSLPLPLCRVLNESFEKRKREREEREYAWGGMRDAME